MISTQIEEVKQYEEAKKYLAAIGIITDVSYNEIVLTVHLFQSLTKHPKKKLLIKFKSIAEYVAFKDGIHCFRTNKFPCMDSKG